MDGGQTSPTVFAGSLCLDMFGAHEAFGVVCLVRLRFPGVFQSLVPGCRAFKNPEAESLKACPALGTRSNKPGSQDVRTQVATACSCHKIEMCLRRNAKTNMAARSPRWGQKDSEAIRFLLQVSHLRVYYRMIRSNGHPETSQKALVWICYPGTAKCR